MPRPRRNSSRPFVAERSQGAEDGVGVDAEEGGKVARRWEALAGFRFAVADRSADLGGDLLVEAVGWSRSILAPIVRLMAYRFSALGASNLALNTHMRTPGTLRQGSQR
jgi:hypothetical protein